MHLFCFLSTSFPGQRGWFSLGFRLDRLLDGFLAAADEKCLLFSSFQ